MRLNGISEKYLSKEILWCLEHNMDCGKELD